MGSGDIAAVEAEMRAWALEKFNQLYLSSEGAENGIIKPHIMARTPIETGLLRANVSCEHHREGVWQFSILTFEKSTSYPGRDRTTDQVAAWQERGTKWNRAKYMFRDGSESAYPEVDQYFGAIWM